MTLLNWGCHTLDNHILVNPCGILPFHCNLISFISIAVIHVLLFVAIMAASLYVLETEGLACVEVQ